MGSVEPEPIPSCEVPTSGGGKPQLCLFVSLGPGSRRSEAFARLKAAQIEELADALAVTGGQRSEAGEMRCGTPSFSSFSPSGLPAVPGVDGAGRVFRFSTPLSLQIDSGVAASMASVITPNTQKMTRHSPIHRVASPSTVWSWHLLYSATPTAQFVGHECHEQQQAWDPGTCPTAARVHVRSLRSA